ncbi:hypothetical protein AJ79_09706 [Helicocarpus griseus UAMH5409]|uniref:Uncharacterized protein n=1 Tax=Helicocarpus griseus UAMH5409 TaxID=1447875 RepID=A0A2B7WHV6_9EURO|nr:hypothetical protein AJ79_09706 [Helicocarpus griseus UAMH5409]
MQRAWFTREEVQLATERRQKYLGTAKASLRQIQFDPPLPHDLDSKNLERLRQIFRKTQCRRLDIENHVPVTVSEQDLTKALEHGRVPRQALLTNPPPFLEFPAGLRGLHGRHRVQAGSELLPPLDRWWTVDLYLDDVGDNLRTALIEEYANQKKPTDGEVYRKIRQYEGEQNEPFRQRWVACLSKSNRERLDQLDNSRNRQLRQAFDALLVIPGLWGRGMRISMIHRLIAITSIEHILNYLGFVKESWSSWVNHDLEAMKKISRDDVERLELMAPGISRVDAKAVCGLVLSGQAFAGFSQSERMAIWSRMEGFGRLVPSLYTFFEDFKYLESCAHCVKRLCRHPERSIWNTMQHMFVKPPESEKDCLIQTSESSFRQIRMGSMECLDLAYRQVWLYAMRHYPSMPPDPKSEDELLAKPNRAKADERVVYEMAELAHRLGFQSPEITALINWSPDRQIARAALLQARRPGRFRYDAHMVDTLVDRIVDCFSAAVPDQTGQTYELLADSIVKPQARCGMPQMRAHKQDSPLLFLDHLHTNTTPAADTITTFFVRQCVYFAFFGKPLAFQSADEDGFEQRPLTDLGIFMHHPSGKGLAVTDELVVEYQSTGNLTRGNLQQGPGNGHSAQESPEADVDQINQQHWNLGQELDQYSESQYSEPANPGSYAERAERPVTRVDLGNLESMPGVVDDQNGSNSNTQAFSDRPIGKSSRPSPYVQISFLLWERGEWRQTNCLTVDYSNLSQVERVAREYTRKKYSLYDINLQSLSPAQCFRAATMDGSNAIFMISEEEERKESKECRTKVRSSIKYFQK